MRIIEITSTPEGGHDNQFSDMMISIPCGWALIPDNMICENFPFGDIEIEEIDGVITVTKWIPRTIPDLESAPNLELTLEERIAKLESENAAMATDLTSTQLALCDVYEQLIMVTDLSGTDETDEEEVLP